MKYTHKLNNFNKIYLLGFMGSGKTTVGKILAKRLGRHFVDLDAFIESKSKKPIKRIFSESGEEFFRDIESECLNEVSNINSQYVVSTGGGAVLSQFNWELMNANGTTIYLEVDLDTIWKRIRHNNKRPLFNIKTPLGEVKRLFAERKELYEKADFTVKSSKLTAQKVADEVVSIIKGHT